MKRGGPLRRYTPLLARAPLRRRSELRRSAFQVAGKSAEGKPAVRTPKKKQEISGGSAGLRASRHSIERDSAAIVRERSGGICEIQLDGCTGRACEMSHRIARGMGGCHGVAKRISDRPADLMHSCSSCHRLITERAWEVGAEEKGLILRHGCDAAREPVLYRGELSYLDDAGGVWSFEEAGA